jgi:hypothetical protein
MNLATVMDQIGDRLDTIPDLNVFRYPPDRIEPPAVIIGYPEEYGFDKAFGRGIDQLFLPVRIVEGKVSVRATRDRLAAYVNGSGARSFKQVIESGTYTAFTSIRGTGWSFDVSSIAGTDYQAATLTLDIQGTGA